MTFINNDALDRYITGNYGEDQFEESPTLTQRIERAGLQFKVTRVPHGKPKEFPGGSTWRYRIWVDGDDATTPTPLVGPFYMGSAHTDPPTLHDVLSCLLSDAAAVEGSDFPDFCNELGYEQFIEHPVNGDMIENRKARRTYDACWKIANDLRAFFGDEAYNAWLYETEND